MVKEKPQKDDSKKEVRTEKKLTVIIPTYNRKKRLERTLKLLEMQTNQSFYVIIIDNCSNYCIEDVITERGALFRERVKVVHNKYNIGMNGNLANAFLQEGDGWIWTLSDDDIPSIYAIEEIYGEIERCPDIDVIHFTIRDYSNYMVNETKECYNLKELVQFYDKVITTKKARRKSQGDFIYFSNKVYKMSNIQKYIDKVVLYSYTGVPQLIPILLMLDEGKGKLCISNRKIITYDDTGNDHWNWIDTMLGMRTIADLPLNLNKKQKRTLYSLIIPDYRYFLRAINKDNAARGVEKMKILYKEIYKEFLKVYESIDLLGRTLIIKIKYNVW